MKKMKQKDEPLIAMADDALNCCICGELIIGEYDFSRTRRKTMLYFHKGMKCRKEK